MTDYMMTTSVQLSESEKYEETKLQNEIRNCENHICNMKRQIREKEAERKELQTKLYKLQGVKETRPIPKIWVKKPMDAQQKQQLSEFYQQLIEISSLSVATRIINVMQRRHITVDELKTMNPEDIYRLRGFGIGSLNALYKVGILVEGGETE